MLSHEHRNPPSYQHQNNSPDILLFSPNPSTRQVNRARRASTKGRLNNSRKSISLNVPSLKKVWWPDRIPVADTADGVDSSNKSRKTLLASDVSGWLLLLLV
ncbi:hypothetical protein BaRGS_00002313 [Batillaria attramentaria]|uniref:Uncharacterized protein n=1 Tax=Batillaria attramentaria TaxID=370345 RepID=A0ABD0M382_9CAEN